MSKHYFDHAATTPLHPAVLEAMVEVMQEGLGNASSLHSFGRDSRRKLGQARDAIAQSLGCRPSELVFTSGGTESDNLALIGAAQAMRKKGKKHIVTTAAEHHAVLHTCQWLERELGFELTIVPVDTTGRVTAEAIRQVMRQDTGLVSVMHGNNEVGTLQPIDEIGEIVHSYNALLHVDAVQSLGTQPYDLGRLSVDLMSFSAHKLNGPQGIGALYVADGIMIEPLQHGGLQERRRRAGTENVAGIIGFAKAIEISQNRQINQQPLTAGFRNKWIEQLASTVKEVPIVMNGSMDHTLPHIVNVSFVGIDTEVMLMNLDMAGIAASGGSACTSGAIERSHVLRAMGLSSEIVQSAVRFSFGLGNTLDELEEAVGKIGKIVTRICRT